ncbi:SDR family oxidoreductase [candidate division KSB1 bacterium]|nr:MAG: SDR family oxidoreductase [candidate division KSB1 bacterium]MBC6947394.1 NAD-dependent epimerase/dehydratase family protein [candidate division KSB1 bacterium]MCE7942539.1 NAD-dependent epimerase/dehydratase family protein [Chlorobi bacterium CHB1]
MSLNVLFIGGTGTISSACVQRAVERGMQLCLLNRGQSRRSVPPGVEILRGDIRNKDAVQKALGSRMFDAVVEWIAFTPDHIEVDLELFRGRTSQYVFISSASVYQTPPASLPVTESTPLRNPFWAYSRAKIACEDRLIKAYREENFPITIVRPSHTYDRTLFPMHGQYTILHRMRAGKKVIVHGDGASLWTLTHHRDFAKGFVGLLGLPQAIGETFHITSDEVLTWNQIFEIVAHAAGVQPRIVHIPSEFIAAFDPDWGASLLGDKTHSMIFDNTKIKRFVPDYVATIPFARGAEEVVNWFDANPAKKVVNEETDRLIDKIIAAYELAWPSTQ